MTKSKAVYPGRIKVESYEVGFSEEQLNFLYAICNKAGFIENIQFIAENYLLHINLFSKENKTWTTERENFETLEDLMFYLKETERKLRNMPDKINSMLYKVDQEIDIAIQSLEKISTEGSILKKKIRKPKTGRPEQSAKKSAAQSLRRVFQNYNLPWKHYCDSQRNGIPAAVMILSLIFYFENSQLDHDGIMRTEYSCNPDESLDMVIEYIKKTFSE